MGGLDLERGQQALVKERMRYGYCLLVVLSDLGSQVYLTQGIDLSLLFSRVAGFGGFATTGCWTTTLCQLGTSGGAFLEISMLPMRGKMGDLRSSKVRDFEEGSEKLQVKSS